MNAGVGEGRTFEVRGVSSSKVIRFDQNIPAQDRVAISDLLGPRALEALGAGPVEVLPLPGGANNRNYTICGSRAKLAARIALESGRLRVDRTSSCTAQQDAARAGLAPEILQQILPQGHFVSTFLEGSVLDSPAFTNLKIVRAVARTLRELHGLPIMCRVYSPFDDIQHWADLARQDGTPFPTGLQVLLQEIDRVAQAFAPLDLPLVFCHNDVVPQNFILGADGRVRMVDWDFAGRGWACFELASVVSAAGLDEGMQTALVDAYDPEADEGQRARVKLMVFVAALRETTWALMAGSTMKGETNPSAQWSYQGYMEHYLRLAQSIYSNSYLPQLIRTASGLQSRKDW